MSSGSVSRQSIISSLELARAGVRQSQEPQESAAYVDCGEDWAETMSQPSEALL